MAALPSWWSGVVGGQPSPTQEPDRSFKATPMEIPEETHADVEELPTRRIHILGLGSIGTLIAHSLKILPNPPPVTLLMHRPAKYEEFKQKSRLVRLINKNTEVNDEQGGFDVDLLESNEKTELPFWRYIPDTPADSSGRTHASNPLEEGERLNSGEVYIYNLIVTVKGSATVAALSSVRHRVDRRTTICLMQNGMGQIDELNRLVFTDAETRPTYMLGIISHGAYLKGSFAVNHAGIGATSLGIYRDPDKYPLPSPSSNTNIQELSEEERKRLYPSDKDLYSNLSSRFLLRTLTRSPVLACAPFPYLDLLQLQLEKLAMNAVLNPLTALLDVPNGSMLENDNWTRVQRLLIAEISLVIRGLPELEGMPGTKMRFSASRLEFLLKSITKQTGQNSSSMREDVRNMKPTEIDYINGYIVKRGEQQGIKCVLNYMIMQLIKGKTWDLRFGEATPYGVSSIESVDPGQQDGDSVMLEDKGTGLRGQAH